MIQSCKKPILVILVAGIGDLVLGSKSIRAIKAGFPDREIHLITSAAAYPLACNYGFVDKVWAFPIRELRRSIFPVVSIIRMLLALRKIKYEKAVNLYRIASIRGALRMGLLFIVIRAYSKIGHDSHGFGLFVDTRLPADIFTEQHIADAMIEIGSVAGGIPDEDGLELHWGEESEDKWEYLFIDKSSQHPRTVFAINAGGDRKNRHWKMERFAAVAEKLSRKYQAEIILLGGPGEEVIAQKIQDYMNINPINLAGRLTVNDLAYIISKTTLLITNDSGPMHMAAASGTAQVAIFGPEDPKLFGPYTSLQNYVVIHKMGEGHDNSGSALDSIDFLKRVSVEDVLEGAQRLIKELSL